MKMRALVLVVAVLMLTCVAGSQQSAPGTNAPSVSPQTAPADLAKRLEVFLRKLYAWGPEFQIKIGSIGGATKADLYEVPVEVTLNGQSDTATIFVSKDGRYVFRGDVQDLSPDPLASVRQQMQLEGYASKGPASAKVVLVEFGDFECPSCRQLDAILREVLALPRFQEDKLALRRQPNNFDALHFLYRQGRFETSLAYNLPHTQLLARNQFHFPAFRLGS